MVIIRATFDADGLNPTFYPSDIFEEQDLPEGCIVISYDDWQMLITYPNSKRWDGSKLVDYAPYLGPQPVPDGPTLSDWRVGLLLWGRRDDLLARVATEVAKGTVIGKIADERVNFANNVYRAQLMQLKDLFAFTEADVDESLWRADRVRQGDISGKWPLTDNAKTS